MTMAITTLYTSIRVLGSKVHFFFINATRHDFLKIVAVWTLPDHHTHNTSDQAHAEVPGRTTPSHL